MKTRSSLIAFFVLGALAINNTSDAKSPVIASPVHMSKVYSGVFDAFHVHRQQNVSALQWRATGDITSFTIEHSFDGTYFNFVADVSPDGSTWNRYQHADALPGYNYYRITAHMADGTTEYSETVVLRIVSRK